MLNKSKIYLSTAVISAAFLSACGGGGNAGSGGGLVTDTTAPTVTFSPDVLTIVSGRTGASTLTATDTVSGTVTPAVSCTNGGAFDIAGGVFTAPAVTQPLESICTATAEDASGNEGTGTLTVTINPNSAPAASAASNITTVLENQPFTLDASMSTDADGDMLSYEWDQVGGTAITIPDRTAAILNLTAPVLSADEMLIFEVAVSDGESTAIAVVEIDAMDLPVPVLTNSAPSSYNNDEPLRLIYAINPNDDGGYKIHWRNGTLRYNSPTSSQDFSNTGDLVGSQIDGEIETGVDIVNGPFGVVINGNTHYNVNMSYDRSIGETRISTTRGLISGTTSIGDVIWTARGDTYADFKAIGSDQLVFVLTGENIISGFLVQPDGTFIEVPISSAEGFEALRRGSIAAFANDSYAALWKTSFEFDSNFMMQRVSTDGVLLGEPTKLNDEPEVSSDDVANPTAGTLSGGNVFVIWTTGDQTISENEVLLKGRIVRPDGTFATNELTLENSGSCIQTRSQVTPLKTNQAFISWVCQNSGGPPFSIRGQVYNSDGTPAGNEIELTQFDPDWLLATALEDDKLIFAWSVEEDSYTLSFYPVGK